MEPVGQLVEQLADGRGHALLLDGDGRVAEAGGELEGIHAVRVHDAVHVDVADVALRGQLLLHLLQGHVEDLVGLAPEVAGAHLPRGRTDVAREELLVLEVHADRVDELLAVEEGARGHLHPHDALLELELADLLRPGAFVVLEHLDHVFAVVVLPHEQELLGVLRRPRGLDHVAVGLALHEGDGLVEGGEVLLRDDRHPRVLQLVLAEGAVVLELVGVGAAPHHLLAALAQRLGLRSLPQDVVEHDHVSPVRARLPGVHLGHEAVADLALVFALDEVADLVPLLHHLPGDVTDEPVDGHEQEAHRRSITEPRVTLR